ncbi:XrtY-associated glycosyltransferase XYAG1 [Pedobacter lithocola]|uniref:XrtY-associated glycosyltransferase XYAG1 n=1 Tax=Pedobacter lithocola TaxID=1908239 RepID=A0ABV8P8N1_9SPHI
MTIIHITPSYKPAYTYGGPIHSIAKLCEVLVKSQENKTECDYKIRVFTTTANGKTELNIKPGEPQIIEGVQVIYYKRLTKDHSHFSPALLLNLRKEIIKNGSENSIIHIHAWWNLTSIFSCFIAKWHNVPIVVSPRGMLTSYTFNNRNSCSKRVVHAFFGKRLLKYCHIHTTSNQEKEDVLKIVKPKSISVISNLVNLKDYNIEESNSSSIFKVIFLSRIEEKKGLELLFEALASLNFSWSLTIAGSGEEEYLQRLLEKAEKLNITENITWTGQVSNSEKFDLLAAHDVCALTSYNENFANVVVESLSVGTSVLISDKVGLSDYVKIKGLGWVTPLNVKEIKHNLSCIFQDKPKLELIRKCAPKIILEDFDDSALASKYVAIYRHIIKSSSRETIE